MDAYHITQIVLQERDDRRRNELVRWHRGAIPHAYRDPINGLIYERTGQTTDDGVMIYRTAEWTTTPRQLLAQFEYGVAASRQLDTLVPDPPPDTYTLGGHTFTFFGWADAGRHIPMYRCPDA